MKSAYSKIASIAVIIAILASVLSAGVFAFFKIIKNGTGELGTSSSESFYDISSYSELVLMSAPYKHNDSSSVSDSSQRHVLRLTKDITLGADLFIESDVSIDLGGHTLYLDGYTLTFTHSYHGSTVISNGNIALYREGYTDSSDNYVPAVSGNVVFDLINSTPVIDRVNFLDDSMQIISDTTNSIYYLWGEERLEFAEKYAAYNALYTVASSLINEYDARKDRLTYNEVIALGEISFENILFERDGCEICSDSNICVYCFEDIDLPKIYHSGDIVTIEYETDNSALSDRGNIDISRAPCEVNLTVKVTSGELVISDTVLIHLFNPEDEDSAFAYAKAMLLSHLSTFYNGTEYVFNRGIHLPSRIGNVSFDYTVYSDREGTAELTGAFTPLTENYLINFEPTIDSKLLVADIKIGGSTVQTLRLDMRSENTGIISTNASVAKNITESWYGGGKLVINPIIDGGVVTGYTTNMLIAHSESLLTKYGISAVEYELMNNSYGVYEIVPSINGYTLQVVTGMNPEDYVQDVFVNCKFTFDGSLSSPSLEQVQIPIVYDASSQGNNVNRFLPYYTYYNEMLYGKLAGSTSHTFEIPFCYGTQGPIICYDVLVYDADGNAVKGCPSFLTIALYWGGSEKIVFDYDGVSDGKDSMTELLDEYLDGTGTTLQEIIDAADAKWVFKLDNERTPSTDTPIELVYNYKMDTRALSWATYPTSDEPITSKLVLLGILHLGTDIPSEELYAWIYNKFNISNDTYTSYANGDFIVTDWLRQNISVDIKNKTDQFPFPTSANLRFKGLEYLVGTKYLDLSAHPALSDAETADEAAIAISQMTSLETLILSDNAFRDREGGATDDLERVSRFASLQNLRYLYLNGNDIYSFEWMLNMPVIEIVHVYQNSFSGLEQVFYGSEGLVNLHVFEELTGRGVSVYNGISGENEILFEELNEINDYIRLRAIEYQKKLAMGIDISEIYSDFENRTASDFGLSSTYTYTVTANDGTVTQETTGTVSHSISFDFVGGTDENGNEITANTATAFTLTDTITVGNTEVRVIITFDVIRF